MKEKGSRLPGTNIGSDGKRHWPKMTQEQRQAQQDRLYDHIQKSEPAPVEKEKEVTSEEPPSYTDEELANMEKQIAVKESLKPEEPDLSTEPKIPTFQEQKEMKEKLEKKNKNGDEEPWYQK